MSDSPLTGRLPAQAAGSFVTGSSPPQALIQRRQRLAYVPELRLRNLVKVSWSALQRAANDSAVAQPARAVFTRLAPDPELTGFEIRRSAACDDSETMRAPGIRPGARANEKPAE